MSGAKYEGAFAFDQRHGHGKYTFANGEGMLFNRDAHAEGMLQKMCATIDGH